MATKVVFIMGSTRSGTTIVDSVFGAVKGFASTGELRTIWERGLLTGGICGCGERVATCSFWNGVLLSIAPRPQWHALAGRVLQWQRRHLRVRNLLSFLQSNPRAQGLDSYLLLLSKLYKGVAQEGNARVVVDSTKRPTDAALLRFVPHIAPYIVHLVRDPRAVAYSWQRRKHDRTAAGLTRMERWGPIRAAVSWTSMNAASELVRRVYPPARVLLLRYEDFVERPEEATSQVLALIGEETATTPFVSDRDIELGRNHSVSGNPVRFSSGSIAIRDDEEWKWKQPLGQRILATSVTLPLMWRYSYRLVPGS